MNSNLVPLWRDRLARRGERVAAVGRRPDVELDPHRHRQAVAAPVLDRLLRVGPRVLTPYIHPGQVLVLGRTATPEQHDGAVYRHGEAAQREGVVPRHLLARGPREGLPQDQPLLGFGHLHCPGRPAGADWSHKPTFLARG